MKLIAHRGASLEAQENTLAALELGAAYGAFAVECDPRYTADRQLVLFHDGDLDRIAGDPRHIRELTLAELRDVLTESGKMLTTLDDVVSGYRGKSAVLFDLPYPALDEAMFAKIAAAPFRSIVGVHDLMEMELARKYFTRENILAFLYKPELAADFTAAGAGIVRLAEKWLPEHPVSEIRKQIPADCEIWIMSNDQSGHPFFCMNGSPEALKRYRGMGADGVLLNDIAMAVKLQKGGTI